MPKISELTTGGTPTGAEYVPVVQSGVTVKLAVSTLTDALTGFDEISFVIDGGGVTITTGLKGVIPISFACAITQAELLADQSGSIVINILKCTYAQYDAGSTHPVIGDKINASAPPTIATATKATDSTLTGWTTSISAGDVLGFYVSSVTSIQRVTVSLKVSR